MIWPFRRVRNLEVGRDLPALQSLPSVVKCFPHPGAVFTPTQPRQGVRSLVGRSAELMRILQALCDDHAHVVLYSERGQGKTSLVNAVIERLRQGGTAVCRYSCEADSTFDSVILGLAGNLPASLMTIETSVSRDGCAACLPQNGIKADDVAALPTKLNCRDLVCILDEFDRIVDDAVVARMADTIKKLSDRRVPLRFVIVGVSENLEQLLMQHESIQRNIAAVQLAPLRDPDIAALIEGAVVNAGCTIAKEVIMDVVQLARGNPHLAQLLGLRLMQGATARGSRMLDADDLNFAVAVLIREAPPKDASLWSAMTAHGRNKDLVIALQKLAAAKHDEWGRFHAPHSETGDIQLDRGLISAQFWRVIEEAKLLRAVPVGSDLYVFRNRSMMHYISMLKLNEKRVEESEIDGNCSAFTISVKQLP